MKVDIKRLTPELADDFLKFFDNDAFSDNPDWAECYCCFFYFKDGEFEERTGKDNRSYAQQAIKDGAMNGWLAYTGGEPVGWINADDKKSHVRLEQTGEQKVLSIVCFTISPKYRRKGIATELLGAAIDGAIKDGFDYIEAYPAKDAKTDAHNYHGPLELYKKMGFEIAEDKQDNWIVRKYL